MDSEDIEKFFRLYDEIKSYIRRSDKHLYERWKAGGFLVDTDVLSMYPNVSEALEALEQSDSDEDVDQDATRQNG